MKFQVQHLKFMPKKEQVMLDMQVKKLQFSLVVVLLMVQKVNWPIKKLENLTKVKKQSIASLISDKNKNKNLIIFNDFNNEIKKTKEMNNIVKKFEITNSLIILDKKSKDKIEKSIRNIPNIKITDVNHFSAFDIIKYKKIVFTESSLKELEKRYSS